MATDISSAPINGTYGNHTGFDQSNIGYSNSSSQSNYGGPAPSSTTPATSTNSTTEIPKDEVGWYFVEQYYTTLSRSPEKLHLFYNKRSQFVLGQETDKVAVCVGQKAINERLKELDFQDCKVRVTNVDSQASDTNIVIQVIGEISNKSQPHKKFTQTFVLAGQTNGYFVLNDIFRYIIEEEDEPQQEAEQTSKDAVPSGYQDPAPTATAAQPDETLTSSSDPAAIEESAHKVDEELENRVVQPDRSLKPAGEVNGDVEPSQSELVHAEEAPVAAPLAADESRPASPEVTQQTLEPEKPKDPEPSPSLSPKKKAAQPATSPAAPSKPAAPKSWADLAAAAHRVVTPAVPVPQRASSPAPAQAKAAPVPVAAPSTSSAPSTTPAVNASGPRDASPASSQQGEWTSVGENKKQQSKGQVQAGSQEGPQNRAYIKNVHEGVDAGELRATLEKFGELAYFDVSRQKNCAFVDFKNPDGYKAAVEANPHQIGNERIIVEERRLKPGSYPYVQRGGMRGGRGGANQGPGRGSFQGRGGFSGRGRGNTQSRGRGGNAQAA